jgi:hypothetical protein
LSLQVFVVHLWNPNPRVVLVIMLWVFLVIVWSFGVDERNCDWIVLSSRLIFDFHIFYQVCNVFFGVSAFLAWSAATTTAAAKTRCPKPDQ